MIKLNSIKSLGLISVLALSVSCSDANSEIKPALVIVSESLVIAPNMLKVGEGFKDPLGYYEAEPRFSWEISTKAKANRQTAYQIQVASSESALVESPDLWNSDKVLSSETSWVNYGGIPLKSRQKVFWKVRFWDENDQVSNWSRINTFELGLLKNADWKSQWIGHPDTALKAIPSKETVATPQYLRKTFQVSADIKQARLYITAKGLFKPFINGLQVSEKDVMTPGWTPYQKRIETLTYDLTEKLTQGENTLAASLAGGWYSGRVADLKEQDHVLPPRLLAQLEITYENGQVDIITTDNNWKTTQEGPIRFASNYDGERYEQGYEMPGWTSNSFNDHNWANAIAEPLDENVKLRPKRHEPIRFIEELAIESIVSQKGDVVILDFGQNMVGVPRINIPVIAGQEVRIRFAEALHKGAFYTDNYRSALSTDYYLPNQTGNIEYQPTFTYHGYRYIEIKGFDPSKIATKDWATALIQHSDIKLYGNFTSSHTKLNQLSENIVWGLRSNFYDIPLDCPQRDERLGWTGDANVFVTPSMYMADVYGFWSAWLESVREDQKEDGMIPVYVPFVEWINWASSGWGDAATIIPWELYMVTGDKTILVDNYDMMKGWVNYHTSHSTKHISNMKTFGDWLQPYPDASSLDDGEGGAHGDTDYSLISTAFYARSVELTIKSAKVLNKTDDVKKLSALHKKIVTAYREHFFDEQLLPKKGMTTQTSYLLGLEFGLFKPEEKGLALEKLIELLHKADNHLRTGFLGTPLLISVLKTADRSDLIYDLLFKETYPSWFYSINNGATTTWERWNSYTIDEGFNPQGMNSLNHYAYGTVSRWFYEGILGINPLTAGFKHIRIEPQFSDKLSQAKGGYITPQGEVTIDWTIVAGQLTMSVNVPKNTTADILLPKVNAKSMTLNGNKLAVNGLKSLQPGTYVIAGSISL
ncbi:glycoside hydrolase family 78 protein [Paraglaciecola aquimarina]|uniref:alpha-L-rhamnosidase n=1 Tax=Paraglaciecola algarum TaxID=3050085 RepID=A0ABS9D917_9ALTE|nr:alpha-L-rhamnosidase [Paraglaciecola sp. G1-23]MCF2948870.1 glycoside hydrolase family 78 protein [Paraglaciecola sp. G1-23]